MAAVTPIDANAICKAVRRRLPQAQNYPRKPAYPMMHTASAVPLTPCIYYTCSCQSPSPTGKSFRATFSTPPSSAFLSFLPLSTFYPAFQKLQKPNNTDKGQGRRMIKPHREPLGRHGNRILLFRPEKASRLTCRIITRRYIRSTEGKGMALVSAVVSEEGRRMKKVVTI